MSDPDQEGVDKVGTDKVNDSQPVDGGGHTVAVLDGGEAMFRVKDSISVSFSVRVSVRVRIRIT